MFFLSLIFSLHAQAVTGVENFHKLSAEMTRVSSSQISNEPAEIFKLRGDANILLDVSRTFANDWDAPNAVHHAHLVLGRLALIEGNLDGAKRELLAAARVGGSPQLNSFGPNMYLAAEMLEQNRVAAVLQYFDLVEKFWNSREAQKSLTEWRSRIRAGLTPTFGPNLRY